MIFGKSLLSLSTIADEISFEIDPIKLPHVDLTKTYTFGNDIFLVRVECKNVVGFIKISAYDLMLSLNEFNSKIICAYVKKMYPQTEVAA